MNQGLGSESIARLVEQAKSDKDFFHDLVWNTEAAIAKADYLTPDERQALTSATPEDLVLRLAGTNVPQADCGATCGASCGASCGATCGASCGGSCGASCAATCAVSGLKTVPDDPADDMGQPVSPDQMKEQISSRIGQTFTKRAR